MSQGKMVDGGEQGYLSKYLYVSWEIISNAHKDRESFGTGELPIE